MKKKDESPTVAATTAGHEDNNQSKNNISQNQAGKIVAMIEKLGVELFNDQHGEPYARFKVKSHFEVHKVKSESFRRWLSNILWKAQRKAPSNHALSSALNIIEAKACYDGEKYTLHNRVAWYGDAIWYDLGNWKAVRVNGSGWEVVEDPPILFKRYQHHKQQVVPRYTPAVGELNDIFKFVTITNGKDRLLYIASLICSFVPDIPHPIDILVGDQGTAKTTRSRVKKELVDPSHLDTQTVPKNTTEFVQMADHNWFFTLDNLTSLLDWLSDALCRVSTGDGFSKRQLYTDDEDVIYKFRRCACITGINLVATKPDLLDRSIIYELEPIPGDKRKTEKEFWEDFNAVKEQILGACFTLLSRAMDEYERVVIMGIPRMADFAIWGCAIARALGNTEKDFLEAYKSNIIAQNQEALEASPVATLMIVFMEGQEEWKSQRKWEGSPTELLSELKRLAEAIGIDTKYKRFPKEPNWLWRCIKEVRTNLMAVGIVASRDDTNRSSTERRITIEKKSISDLNVDDTTDDSRDDMSENAVTHNYLGSLENDSNDSSDSIFRDTEGDNVYDQSFDDIPDSDPWDEVDL